MSYTVEFGDTEFSVPSRYLELAPKGVGAQGMVWWVEEEDLYSTWKRMKRNSCGHYMNAIWWVIVVHMNLLCFVLELAFHWCLIFLTTNHIKRSKILLLEFPTSCTADSEDAFYKNIIHTLQNHFKTLHNCTGFIPNSVISHQYC